MSVVNIFTSLSDTNSAMSQICPSKATFNLICLNQNEYLHKKYKWSA